MSRRSINGIIVLVAICVHGALALWSGTTSVNGGLGAEGVIYAAMVTDHDLQRSTAAQRLTPGFPLASAIPFAATGNIVRAFLIVNAAGFVLLVLATCMLLDSLAAPLAIKLSAAFAVTVLGMPTAATAFNPGQPDLLALALVVLAVAAAEAGRDWQVLVTHVAAVLATPLGIIAPLYGLARRWRLRQLTLLALAVLLPALLLSLLVQVRARGGPRGVLELLQFSRVAADVSLWNESEFMLAALYFVPTSLGGLTILLWSRPRWLVDAVREKPEAIALAVPVAVLIASAGLDMPRMIPFLIPFWLVAVGLWSRRQGGSLAIPAAMAAVLTLLTQHPWARVDEASYFVDWFPYSVHAGRVDVDAAVLRGIWRWRAVFLIGGLAAFVAWRRLAHARGASHPSPGAEAS